MRIDRKLALTAAMLLLATSAASAGNHGNDGGNAPFDIRNARVLLPNSTTSSYYVDFKFDVVRTKSGGPLPKGLVADVRLIGRDHRFLGKNGAVRTENKNGSLARLIHQAFGRDSDGLV